MVGVDSTGGAQQGIRDGSEAASVLFPLGGLVAVNMALKIFDNESIPKHIYNPVELITKTKVEKVAPIF